MDLEDPRPSPSTVGESSPGNVFAAVKELSSFEFRLGFRFRQAPPHVRVNRLEAR